MADSPSWKKQGKFVMAFIVGATGVVAALKSFAETATGTKFEANQFPFYLGAATVAVYLSVGIGIAAGGLVAFLVNAAGVDEDSATPVLLGVTGLVAVVVLVVIAQAGVLFDYDGTDAIGRAFLALLGIGAVGGGIWYLFVKKEDEPT